MVEGFKLRLAIILFVCFLMSGWYSLQELRYLTGGHVVDATVAQVEIREERVYRRRMGSYTRQFQAVSVRFSGRDNTSETRSFTLPIDRPVQLQQTLKIQYLPTDTGMVRISGSANWIAVLFFVGSLLALTGTIVWVGMEANRPYGNARLQADDRPVRAIQPKKKKRALKPLKPLDEA